MNLSAADLCDAFRDWAAAIHELVSYSYACGLGVSEETITDVTLVELRRRLHPHVLAQKFTEAPGVLDLGCRLAHDNRASGAVDLTACPSEARQAGRRTASTSSTTERGRSAGRSWRTRASRTISPCTSSTLASLASQFTLRVRRPRSDGRPRSCPCGLRRVRPLRTSSRWGASLYGQDTSRSWTGGRRRRTTSWTSSTVDGLGPASFLLPQLSASA